MNETNYNLSSSKTYELKTTTKTTQNNQTTQGNKSTSKAEIMDFDSNVNEKAAVTIKEEELAKLEKEKEKLETQKKEIKSRITDEKWDVWELFFNNDKYNKDIDALEKKLKQIEKELKEVNNKITNLTTTGIERALQCELITSYDNEITKLEKEIKALETKIQEKQGELNRKRTAQSRARGLSSISDDDLDKIEKEIINLKEKVKQKKQEKTELKKVRKTTTNYITEIYYSNLKYNNDFENNIQINLTEEEAHQISQIYRTLYNTSFSYLVTTDKFYDYDSMYEFYKEHKDMFFGIDWEIVKKAYEKGFNIYEVAIKNPKLTEASINKEFFPTATFDGEYPLGTFAHIINYMTEEEKNNILYLYNTEGTEAANKYLTFKQQEINSRIGFVQASEFLEKVNNSSEVGAFLKTALKGTGDGIENFFEGLDNALGGMDGVMSASQFETMYIISWMSESDIDKLEGFTKEEKEKLKEIKGLNDSKFLQGTYEISSSIGNMIPSIAASTVVSIAATPVAGKVVGTALMGLSSGGNAAESMYQQGYGFYESIHYGMLSGSSEALLGYFLGGIPGLSKLDDLPGLKGYITNMLMEGGEESLQAIIDPYLQSVALGVEPEIDWDEVAKSGIYGLITAGLLNGGKIYEEIDIDVKKLNDSKYIQQLQQQIESRNSQKNSKQTQNIQSTEQKIQTEIKKETSSQKVEKQHQQQNNTSSSKPQNIQQKEQTVQLETNKETISQQGEQSTSILENELIKLANKKGMSLKELGAQSKVNTAITQEMQEQAEILAQEVRFVAEINEPQITQDMHDLETKNRTLQGLEFKLKGTDSIQRKIISYALKSNITLEKSANYINDSVRYTMVCSDSSFTSDITECLNSLESKGYKVTYFNNSFANNPHYKGINVGLISSTGISMELQFHTEQSLEIKEKNHVYYEIFRNDFIKPEAEEKILASKIMQDNVATIKIPDGIIEYDYYSQHALQTKIDKFHELIQIKQSPEYLEYMEKTTKYGMFPNNIKFNTLELELIMLEEELSQYSSLPTIDLTLDTDITEKLIDEGSEPTLDMFATEKLIDEGSEPIIEQYISFSKKFAESIKQLSDYYGDAGEKIRSMYVYGRKTTQQILNELDEQEKIEFQEFLQNTREGRFLASLSNDEIRAMTIYTGGSYHDINEMLRKKNISGTIVDMDAQKLIDNIDSAIKKYGGLETKTQIYRAVDVDAFVFQDSSYAALFNGIDRSDLKQVYSVLKVLEGKKFGDLGYMSASPAYSASFAKLDRYPIVLDIIADKGTQGAYINQISEYYNEENEFLFARDTVFEMVEVLAPEKDINGLEKIVIKCVVK